MKNIWIICRKELRSYFVSPVAYILLVMFAVIFGFFFWNIVGYFVFTGMESQMHGEPFPMNINEQIIRPLLSNVSVIGLFFIPLITMRLFAEEKRSGTIELLATSPITDSEIILGKWLAAVMLYACLAAADGAEFPFSFQVRQSGLEAAGNRISGHAAAGRRAAGDRNVYFHADAQSDHRRRRDVWSLPAAVGFGLGQRVRDATWAKVLSYMSVITHFESFAKGVLDTKDAIYYVTVIFLGLFFTARSMESLRWRS